MTDPLDFLIEGHIDIKVVEKYLRKLGYTPIGLKQLYRHVTGKVVKNNQEYFFKMASRPGLSVYIENEYEWVRMVHHSGYTKRWQLKVPKIYQLGKMGKLSWWIGEYITGNSADDDLTILPETFIPIAQLVKDILEMKIERQMPLDAQKSKSSFKELTRVKLESYQQKISLNISELIYFLKNHMDYIQIAPARGDIGSGSFMKDTPGKLWFIDWEFASKQNIKFYDIAYFYYRLYIDIGHPDWAEKFIEEFRKIYQLTTKDELTFQWVSLYRLVGGYNEMQNDPNKIEQIQKLQKKLFKNK